MAIRRREQRNYTQAQLAKYKRADNSGAAWHRLVGLQDVVRNNRRQVLLVIEGSKDVLATAEIAHRLGALACVGIICALGSGYRPIRAELEQLCGRWVGVIGDNDAPGIETTQLVSCALADAGVEHGIWSWSKCETDAKDLYGWLVSQKGKNRPYLGTFFSLFSPSPSSTIHPFNYRNRRSK
jgi:hypothetical protein